MIEHNGQELARLENGVLEFADLICHEQAMLFYTIQGMIHHEPIK